MITPAQRVRMRNLAKLENSGTSNIRENLSAYEMARAQLRNHSIALKGIQSIETKGTKKAEYLPDYEPYIAGVLEADSGQADDVITTLLLWSLDAKNYAMALPLAMYCLKHELILHNNHSRTVATAIADELSDAILMAEKPENGKATDIISAVDIQKFYQLVIKYDMPDQVKCKLHKACGFVLQYQWPEAAIAQLEKASQYNERAGVKKLIKKLRDDLENSASEQSEA